MTKLQALREINRHIKMQKELGSHWTLIMHNRWCQLKILFSIPKDTELRRMEREARRKRNDRRTSNSKT